MRTIKKGKPKRPWSIDRTCTGFGNGGEGCCALLRVEEGDLYTTIQVDRAESTTCITFTCHECHTMTNVPWLEVPSSVRARLPTRVTWLAVRAKERADEERERLSKLRPECAGWPEGTR